MNQDQTRWQGYRLKEPRTMVGPDQLLKAARGIGDRLEAISLCGDRETTWVGLELLNDRYWSLVPLKVDLYSGLSGIALFLAYLGAVTRQHRYTELARAALGTIRQHIARGRLKIGIGAFSGWSGLIYTLTHLATIWDEGSLIAEAEEMVELIPPLIEQDSQFDIMNGSSGAIICLLNLYRKAGSERALAVARECGEWLVSHAQLAGPGVGWSTVKTATKPLLGLSHGAAGIAWSLLELNALTGEPRFRRVALDAIAYERSFFSSEERNWPDFREYGAQDKSGKSGYRYMTAWCHGAPGIGIARLNSLRYVDDQPAREEINTALHTTVERGFGLNHSLCHGDLGNADLLLQAWETLGDRKWRIQLDRVASIILESIEEHGLLCGVPLGVETPGLMTGIAGIGYGLLRLAAPLRVPSVLALAPPVRLDN
jgi:type 2 lantibiotic biosynthesis protein LanM